MARYGGHRVPDEYHSDWHKANSLGEYWEWWHLGYEDGKSATEFEYGIPSDGKEREETLKEIERLQKENGQLRELLGANVRVMKEEIKKEMQQEGQMQI